MVLDIVFTAIEGCGCLYIVKDEEIKKNRQILFLILFVFSICTYTRIFTLSEIGIKALFGYGITILLGILILGLSISKSIFYMGISTCLLGLSELVIILIGELTYIGKVPEKAHLLPVMHIILSKIIYITLLAIAQKVIIDVARKRFNIKMSLYFILSNIGYMIVGVCIYINVASVEKKMYSNVLLFCSATMLAALVMNLIFLEKYLKIEGKDQEQKMAIYRLEIQTKYYEERLKQEERVKEIYHDMKNHILLLESNNMSYEEQGEIAKIRKEITQYEDYYRTGNKFLDIIMRDKIAKADEEGIVIENNIKLGGMEFIEPFDISTIFGNLLDNAIEACSMIKEKDKRNIYISAKRQNNFLTVCIRNNKSDQASANLSKKIIHGYGLQNVTNAVHKYCGEIDIKEEKKEFIVNLVIPVREEVS